MPRIPIGRNFPLDLGGLICWYAADRITGVANGGTVSSWSDLSGNNLTASQAGVAKPIFITNELNGYPVVRFVKASSQNLKTATVAPVVIQPITMFLVAKCPSGMVDDNNVFGAASGNTLEFFWKVATGFPNMNAGTGDVAFGNIAAGSFCILTGTVNGASSVGQYNGTAGSAGDAGTGVFTALQIGACSDADYFEGDIAELGLFNGELSASNLLKLTSYLSAKYQISTL